MRLKGEVIGLQTHHQTYQSDTWLWKYEDFSKIPRLIFSHHGSKNAAGSEFFKILMMSQTVRHPKIHINV